MYMFVVSLSFMTFNFSKAVSEMTYEMSLTQQYLFRFANISQHKMVVTTDQVRLAVKFAYDFNL